MAESWVTLKMSYKVNLHPKLSRNRSGLLFRKLKKKKKKDVFGQAPKKGERISDGYL